MFIFRIIFKLIHMAFRAVFGIFLVPLHLIMHHFVLLIGLVLVILLFVKFNDHSSDTTPLPQAPAQQTVTQAPEQPIAPYGALPDPTAQPVTKNTKVMPVDPVMKVENGDSNFSSDLYNAMNTPERTYYSELFYWAMGTLKDNQGYTWNNFNINGRITPLSTFANKLGQQCRTFKEMLKVHTVQQDLSGIACQDPSGAWCKLKVNATPQCGLGYQPGFFESLFAPLKHIF